MSLGIGYLGNSAISNVGVQQNQLQTAFNQASSGKRITNASIDPSGLAIYNALSAQSSGYDTANGNIVDASNALNVAQGGLSTTSDALQQLNGLAIQATNSFLSPTDRAALQAQANQLVQQINTVASDINFNGQPLLTGQLAGSTPATSATATTTNNDAIASGGCLVTSVSASGATQSGTIVAQVVNNGTGASLTFTDNATGTTTNIGIVAAGSTTVVNGTSITLGSFGPGDTNSTATVQATAAGAATTNPSGQVQSGASQGAVTAVTVPNATTTALGIGTIDFSTSATATNAQGQLNAALTQVNLAQGQLGAQTVSLQENFNNNNIASNNLTASASSIGDSNTGSLAAELKSLQLQQQISIQTINNANVAYGFLNRFFSTSA